MRARSSVWTTLLALLTAGCAAGTNDGSAAGSGGSSGTSFVGATTGTGAGTNTNPCGSECGPTERCDGSGQGLDDDCDGEVDEGCPCSANQALACFRGDPAYQDFPGCFPGTMTCTELGTWGPCNGGRHATDACFEDDPSKCHAIAAVPLSTIDLGKGLGDFGNDATSESFGVTCPPGVTPCPTAMGSMYQPLQSGEYVVNYTKQTASGPDSCSFPLYVGARGLRVELSWNYPTDGSATDLDLHLHEPMTATGWSVVGAPQDCGYGNCRSSDFIDGAPDAPSWFSDNATPPTPVNWYEDPDPSQNLCYYAPQGAGADWKAASRGCHNPRLDLDNLGCTPSVTDPKDFDFCAPENVNVDFPPRGRWMRIGVHYYPDSSTYDGPTRPTVRIYCEGALAAELGPKSFGNPETPVSFDGLKDTDNFWLVGDVLFPGDECTAGCIVSPIYVDEATKRPLFVSRGQAENDVGPAYPPIP
jgi:hypothetical protein